MRKGRVDVSNFPVSGLFGWFQDHHWFRVLPLFINPDCFWQGFIFHLKSAISTSKCLASKVISFMLDASCYRWIDNIVAQMNYN
ncbi:Uncharacterised protein [Klebsiella pneumoniae]|nr:Uncharacterised protein [Klebsiella pneumoniae]